MSNETEGTQTSTVYTLPSRFAGGILGGLGLVSLLSGAIDLAPDVAKIVTAYQSITQPVWDFLLGWLFQWVGWTFPWWVKDYLTMGVIVAFAVLRAYPLFTADPSFGLWFRARLFLLFLFIIAPTWPVFALRYVLGALGSILRGTVNEVQRSAPIFFAFIFWAFLIIAVSYGMTFAKV